MTVVGRMFGYFATPSAGATFAGSIVEVTFAALALIDAADVVTKALTRFFVSLII